MNPPTFTLANLAQHRAALVALNVEYMNAVLVGVEALSGRSSLEIIGMPVSDYVVSVMDKVCGDPPPSGAFYLIELDGQLVGMGGLRRLSNEAAEIKRIYVRPNFRGHRLGERILQRLLADAQRGGYRRIHLDSAPFMQSAQRLYEAMGFTDCPPYEGSEVPAELRRVWRFMVQDLRGADPCCVNTAVSTAAPQGLFTPAEQTPPPPYPPR